jgi:hypothetical protein
MGSVAQIAVTNRVVSFLVRDLSNIFLKESAVQSVHQSVPIVPFLFLALTVSSRVVQAALNVSSLVE